MGYSDHISKHVHSADPIILKKVSHLDAKKVNSRQEMQKMLEDASTIDVSEPGQAAVLVEVLKTIPPVKEMQLAHPTQEVIEAIAELNLETLTLRHDGDKGGFDDKGKCFVKLLQKDNLTSLDLEFSKGATELEGVLDGLKKCHLHELKIGNPQGADDTQSLSQVLTGIRSLEKLEVRNWAGEEAVDSLISGLADNNISDFYFRGKFPCHQQLANILQKPDCKLAKLGLVLSNPHLISSDDSSQFSAAVGSSARLENLAFLVDASSGGDCSFLRELSGALHDHKFGSVQLTILNSNISNVNLKAFFKGNVDSLKLTTFGTQVPTDIVTQLLEALQDPDFKIKHLSIGGDAPLSPEDCRKVVRCLQKNFKCPLESLEIGDDWKADPLGIFCEQVLEQNKIYRSASSKVAHGLADEETVEPSGAKFYICGDQNVGRSTLRRNLFKKYNVLAWFHITRESSMHLDNLNFGDKSLLVCDFGGQAELNALHHYLVKGSDKDIFCIVCRAPKINGHQEFEDRLQYWFKFILSHRGLPDRKPKVMIVLNYFPDSERAENVDMNRDAVNRCSTLVKDFSEQIDFGTNNIFGVRATRPSQLQVMKRQMHSNLNTLLKSRPKVPKVCQSIMENVKTEAAKNKQVPDGKIQTACKYLMDLFWKAKSEEPKKVMSLEELLSICRDMDRDFVKVCLAFLHNQGEVIYLEQGSSSGADLNKQYVIVDVWWFAQNIIQLFVHDTREMAIAEVRSKLASHCQEEYFGYMIDVLHQLGVVLVENSGTIVRPLPCWEASEPPAWRNTDKAPPSFWGRRYESRDPHILLPWGFFTVLQMKMAGMFQAHEVGGGWLHVVHKDIQFIIKLGGSTEHRYDRQWIDLLVRFPDAASFNEASNALVLQLKDCLLTICGGQGCPPVELEEKVIRPGSVQDIRCDEAEPLWKILEEADENFHEEGLVTKHSWKKHLGDSCYIFEVMTLSERNRYNNDKLKKLEPIKYEVLDCLPDQATETPISDGILTSGSDEDSEFKRELRKAIVELKRAIYESEQRVILEIKDLKTIVTKEMELLRGQGDKLLGKLKLLIDFDLPKYPYFTSQDNILQKYSREIFGKKMRLHLLCEHGKCHHVENQRGLDINVRPEWFHRSAPVLVPALRILFVGAQIVTTMYLGAKLPFKMPSPFNKDYKFDGVQTLMKQAFGEETEGSRDLYKRFPTPQELQQFYEVFLKSKITNKLKDMNMYFALHQKIDGQTNKPLWVCDEHLRFYS